MLEYTQNRVAGSLVVEQVAEGKLITLPREPFARIALRLLRSWSFWLYAGGVVFMLNFLEAGRFLASVVRGSPTFDFEAVATQLLVTAGGVGALLLVYALVLSRLSESVLLSPHQVVWTTMGFAREGGMSKSVPRTDVLGVRLTW